MGVAQGTLAYLKTFIVTLLVSDCQPVDCGHRGLALELDTCSGRGCRRAQVDEAGFCCFGERGTRDRDGGLETRELRIGGAEEASGRTLVNQGVKAGCAASVTRGWRSAPASPALPWSTLHRAAAVHPLAPSHAGARTVTPARTASPVQLVEQLLLLFGQLREHV